MEIATLVVTTAVAVVGLWAAHSFGRQQRLRVAERRLDDYLGLWKLMETARASRGEEDDPHAAGGVTRDEALKLYDDMTGWYFGQGGGLSLPDETKRLYLEVKKRIGLYAAGRSAGPAGDASRRLLRDLSILRTQLKNDVGVYGRSSFTFGDRLDEGDRELLLAAGISPRHWASRGRPAQSRLLAAIGFDVPRWRLERDRAALEAAKAPAEEPESAASELDTEPLPRSDPA
jgi:hypothetical protein